MTSRPRARRRRSTDKSPRRRRRISVDSEAPTPSGVSKFSGLCGRAGHRYVRCGTLVGNRHRHDLPPLFESVPQDHGNRVQQQDEDEQHDDGSCGRLMELLLWSTHPRRDQRRHRGESATQRIDVPGSGRVARGYPVAAPISSSGAASPTARERDSSVPVRMPGGGVGHHLGLDDLPVRGSYSVGAFAQRLRNGPNGFRWR